MTELFYFDDNFRRIAQWGLALSVTTLQDKAYNMSGDKEAMIAWISCEALSTVWLDNYEPYCIVSDAT